LGNNISGFLQRFPQAFIHDCEKQTPRPPFIWVEQSMHLLDKVFVLRDVHRELRLGARKEGLYFIPIDLSDVQDQEVSEHRPGDNAKCQRLRLRELDLVEFPDLELQTVRGPARRP
jgi:hypothetical protein